MLDPHHAQQFAAAWLAAWNSHELEAILSHYAPDVRFHSPFIARLAGAPSGCLVGTAALRPYFATALAAYPELHFVPITVLPGADSVTLLYRSVNQLLAAEVMVLDDHHRATQVRAHYRPLADVPDWPR